MFCTQVPDLAPMISNPIHAPIAISALSTKRFCSLARSVCAKSAPHQQSSLVIMVIDLHKNKMTLKDNYMVPSDFLWRSGEMQRRSGAIFHLGQILI